MPDIPILDPNRKSVIRTYGWGQIAGREASGVKPDLQEVGRVGRTLRVSRTRAGAA
jgi:hypothetical protein